MRPEDYPQDVIEKEIQALRTAIFLTGEMPVEVEGGATKREWLEALQEQSLWLKIGELG